jgi:hypothetical protein
MMSTNASNGLPTGRGEIRVSSNYPERLLNNDVRLGPVLTFGTDWADDGVATKVVATPVSQHGFVSDWEMPAAPPSDPLLEIR